jgi:hypothetical protein
MKHSRNPTQADPRPDRTGKRSGDRRTYVRPVLQRYGTVGKLTQTGPRSGTDASSMMACL